MRLSFLGSSAGMGGAPSAGTYTNSSYEAPQQGLAAIGEFRHGVSETIHGRISLLMLNSFILLWVLFYIYTNRVQGGG